MKKYKGVNLIDTMTQIVEKHMGNFKDDFYKTDKSILLDKKEISENKTFYWYVRRSGTHLLRPSVMFIKGTWNNAEACYCLDNTKLVYKITIKKHDETSIYGDIEEMTKEQMKKILNENMVEMGA